MVRFDGCSQGSPRCGPGLLTGTHQVKIGEALSRQHPEDRHVRRSSHHDCLRETHRVCLPVAQRSKRWSVAMIPNGSCWVRLKSIESGGEGVHRVRRGIARVDPCVPLIVARSGRVFATITENTFDVPEIKIASLEG